MEPCATCRFFFPGGRVVGLGGRGVDQCRRRRPDMMSAVVSLGDGKPAFTSSGAWPSTDGRGCGEHEPEKEKES